MTHNKIVDIVHVGFIHILIPQFLTDGLVNVIILEVGHLCIRLGMIDTCVRDDCWHLWFGEGLRCLGHDSWLTAIAVGRPKIILQLLHSLLVLVRGSRSNIKDINR